MARQYSRLAQVEKKKATRSLYSYIGLTILLMVFLFFVGVPALARVAELMLGVTSGDSPIEISDTTPPPPPQFDQMQEQTKESEINIQGSAEPGTTIQISINSTTKELVANAEGKFSTKINLKDGENTIFATATDKSGNRSTESTKYTIYFDNTEPTLEVTKPQDGAFFSGTKQKQLTIEGTTEPEAQIFVNDRVAVVASSGKFAIIFSLNDGDNAFKVKAIDPAGNEVEKEFIVKYSP